jgi:hypothetical protein
MPANANGTRERGHCSSMTAAVPVVGGNLQAAAVRPCRSSSDIGLWALPWRVQGTSRQGERTLIGQPHFIIAPNIARWL